ncbi:MAG: hypothetical protein M3430_02760 [Acidobacteriota bacterium]|nr:hypothetical protein [Acidobacteriota bacterium]
MIKNTHRHPRKLLLGLEPARAGDKNKAQRGAEGATLGKRLKQFPSPRERATGRCSDDGKQTVTHFMGFGHVPCANPAFRYAARWALFSSPAAQAKNNFRFV